MTAEILTQRYCRDSDKTFAAIFRVKIHVQNQSNQKLIVENTRRTGGYSVAIASDTEKLSKGKFLFNPDNEWQITHDPPEPGVEPDGDFAILGPGKSFQGERELWASSAGRLHDADDVPNTLRSGNYVLQVSLSTWDYLTKPQRVQKRWKPFGHLVYDDIVSGPLSFYLPPDPKLGKCN
jgi:hypothetical protein